MSYYQSMAKHISKELETQPELNKKKAREKLLQKEKENDKKENDKKEEEDDDEKADDHSDL